MKFRITMLVLLVAFLTVMVGNEAYAIKFYCYSCKSIYEVEGSHKDCVSALKTAPVVQKEKYIQSAQVNTKSSSYSSFNFLKAFVQINVEQRPVRYRSIRRYGYGSYYHPGYTARGNRNVFYKWFGRDHRYRDHHVRRRYAHDDHHRYGRSYIR